MIFASPKTKGFVGPSDTEAPNPVEQTLHEAAAWEPDCPPPADFAAFTKRALEKHKRTPFPPASRPAPATQWVLGLRAPLAASLALGLVLWVGGSVSDLSVPDQSNKTARPLNGEKSMATNSLAQTVTKSDPLVQPTEKARPAVRPVLTESVSTSRSRPNRTSYNARVRRHKRPAEELIAAHDTKQTNPVPLWKTETVERPAWGALIPATFACTTPTSNDAGQESSESETTLMPVVLDVALPETGNLVAASSTDAPSPQPSPAP